MHASLLKIFPNSPGIWT